MRVWLDDIRSMPAGYDVHIKTAREAKRLLMFDRVDHFSFDHDLAIEHYNTSIEEMLQEETGYDLACWIEDNAEWILPFTWDVHSQNPVGAERIRVTMQRVERIWNALPVHG